MSNPDLALGDFRHIQHIVNQGHQMLGGIADLFQTVLHPPLIVNISSRNGRHAQYRIHGRADLMAHTGQKIRLCLIRMFCDCQCILQRLRLFRQLPLHFPQLSDIGDINKNCQINRTAVLPLNTGGINLKPHILAVPGSCGYHKMNGGPF